MIIMCLALKPHTHHYILAAHSARSSLAHLRLTRGVSGYALHQHEGSLGGYLSHLALIPDTGTGVFVSVNKTPDNRVRDMIVMHVLDILLGNTSLLARHC